MPTKLLLYVISLALLQGCTSHIQAKLNDRLPYEAEQSLRADNQCKNHYRLALDNPSTEIVITQKPSSYTGGQTDHSFKIGKILDGYIEQAQDGSELKPIIVSLKIQKFNYELMTNWAVDVVRYEAIFSGPDDSWPITIEENVDIDLDKLAGMPGKYEAVNEALQSTTVKLFKEANKRLCGNSSGGG